MRFLEATSVAFIVVLVLLSVVLCYSSRRQHRAATATRDHPGAYALVEAEEA